MCEMVIHLMRSLLGKLLGLLCEVSPCRMTDMSMMEALREGETGPCLVSGGAFAEGLGWISAGVYRWV